MIQVHAPRILRRKVDLDGERSGNPRERLFVGESDRHEGRPLYEWILLRAREEGLAGATVLRGIAGFGAHSRLHTAKILRLSEDLPIVVEIVDTREKIEAFLRRQGFEPIRSEPQAHSEEEVAAGAAAEE